MAAARVATVERAFRLQVPRIDVLVTMPGCGGSTELGGSGFAHTIVELIMRTRSLLRLASVASLALATALSISSPASAFAGLSDKQKAHIEEFFHCNYLMWTDLVQFEAEQPPCGGTPNVDLKSIAATGSGSTKRERPDPCENYPSGLVTIQGQPEYCPE